MQINLLDLSDYVQQLYQGHQRMAPMPKVPFSGSISSNQGIDGTSRCIWRTAHHFTELAELSGKWAIPHSVLVDPLASMNLDIPSTETASSLTHSLILHSLTLPVSRKMDKVRTRERKEQGWRRKGKGRRKRATRSTPHQPQEHLHFNL